MKLLTTAITMVVFMNGAFALDVEVPTDYSTIQEAVNQVIGSGDPNSSITILSSSSPWLESSIVISGAHNMSISLQSDGSTYMEPSGPDQRFFDILNCDDITITGLIFQDGHATGETSTFHSFGGGIYCENSSLTLQNVQFEDCLAAEEGGALYCLDSDVSALDECKFERNEAYTRGGGISLFNTSYIDNDSDYNDNKCIFSEPVPGNGGGAISIQQDNALPSIVHELTGTSFIGNGAHMNGGAVFSNSSLLDMTDCYFHTNYTIASTEYSAGGGAIFQGFSLDGSRTLLILDQCFFKGNHNKILESSSPALFQGGALCVIGSSIEITDSDFISNGIFEEDELTHYSDEGGAIFCEAICGPGNSTPFIENCRFTENAGNLGGAVFVYVAGLPEFPFRDCIFSSNGSFFDESVGGAGGAVYTQSPGGFPLRSDNGTEFHNCLFYDNYSQNGSAIYANNEGVLLSDCVLSDNHSEDNTGFTVMVQAGQREVQAEVVNTSITHNNGSAMAVFDSTSDIVVLTIQYSNFSDNDVNWHESVNEFENINENMTESPMYVRRMPEAGVEEEPDYRLRWSSPLVDSGDPELPLDFDLTNHDIGLQSTYEEVELVDDYVLNQSGWYTMNADEVLSINTDGLIPGDVVIRMASNSVLEIECVNGGRGFDFGDPEGVRVAVVGVNNPAQQTPSSLILNSAQNENINFHGVLFNYQADLISFQDVDVNLDASMAATTIRFDNYFAGVYEWRFSDCIGSVSGYDFTEREGVYINKISCLSSGIDIVDCLFQSPNTNSYSLLIDSHAIGETPEITDCEFNGSSTSGVPIKIIDAHPKLNGNVVDAIKNYGLYAFKSNFDMSRSAMNSFLSEYDLQVAPDLDFLLFLHDSPAYLECGQNNFVYSIADERDVFDFIRYKGKEPADPVQGAPDIKNWTDNYWGETCTTPISPVSPILRIPSWADEGDLLDDCSTTVPPFSCDLPIVLTMLNGGTALEGDGSLEAASELYSELITQYPTSKEATIAAQRLRIVYMRSTELQAVDELLMLADAVIGADSLLANYLRCASNCVLAYQGDVQSAEQNLINIRDNAMDEEAAAIAQKHLLEIQTYPTVGGLNSGGVNNQLRQGLIAQRQLLDFDPLEYTGSYGSESHSTVQPERLTLNPAYPNPFNPSTTIRFALSEGAMVKARVFNLRGQRVQTLVNKQLEAGNHQIVWDASQNASGVYFIAFETPSNLAQQKVLLLK